MANLILRVVTDDEPVTDYATHIGLGDQPLPNIPRRYLVMLESGGRIRISANTNFETEYTSIEEAEKFFLAGLNMCLRAKEKK